MAYLDNPKVTRSGQQQDGAPLAILTVAYCSHEPLKLMAHELMQQTVSPFTWLIVDNSPDTAGPIECTLRERSETIERLNIKVISGIDGDGFGAGCNRGFAELESTGWNGWIWLLNPDILFKKSNTLEQLSNILKDLPNKALVGTAVWNSDGELEDSAGWFHPGVRFRRQRVNQKILAEAQKYPISVDWLSGCSLLLKPTAHGAEARFDPALPLYYEDMDLCLRLKRAGSPVLWSAATEVIHRRGQGSKSGSERRLRLGTTSYWRFLNRHCTTPTIVARGLRLLTVIFLRLLFQPSRGAASLIGLAEAIKRPAP